MSMGMVFKMCKIAHLCQCLPKKFEPLWELHIPSNLKKKNVNISKGLCKLRVF